MAKSRVPSPKDVIKVRGRELKVGDEIMVPVRVTRIGRNTQDTAPALTIALRNGQRVTDNAAFILGEDEE